MKIAMVSWLINDVGGINSWGENAITGLRRLGHTVKFFHSSPQIRLGCDPDVKVRRGVRYDLLPGTHLSYHADFVADSIAALNEVDLIIFLHP